MGFRVTKCFFCQIKTLTDVLRVEGVHFFSISMLVTMALSVVFNAVFVSSLVDFLDEKLLFACYRILVGLV